VSDEREALRETILEARDLLREAVAEGDLLTIRRRKHAARLLAIRWAVRFGERQVERGLGLGRRSTSNISEPDQPNPMVPHANATTPDPHEDVQGRPAELQEEG
jgi:hypothetical protein